MRQPDRTLLKSDLREVAKLRQHNKDHSFKTRFDELKLDDIAAGDRRNVRASFDRMKELVNRYPGLELDGVLAEKGSISDQLSAIKERVGLIDTFVTANHDTNFLAMDYVPDSPDMKALKFDGLQDAEKDMVLRTMKAHSTQGAATDGGRISFGDGDSGDDTRRVYQCHQFIGARSGGDPCRGIRHRARFKSPVHGDI
jgi:hypothetical protein